MEFSRDDLNEAKRQIDSTLHKLRETIKTFESKENQGRYKSQITLARRRVKPFEIGNNSIENKLKSKFFLVYEGTSDIWTWNGLLH